MDGSSGPLAEKVQSLSDIELATLLCLVADQHCIIETERDLVDGLAQELQLIAADVFGLTCSILNCSKSTTLDEFGNSLLIGHENDDYFASKEVAVKDDYLSFTSESTHPSARRISKFSSAFTPLDTHKIANVIVAKNLNDTNHQVQIQALELITGRRIFTRTAIHAAPKPFLFIALTSSGSSPLAKHLNDQFFISHRHDANEGLPNLEDHGMQASASDDGASASSVIRLSPSIPRKVQSAVPLFPLEDIAKLSTLTEDVKMSAEVRAYLHNIVVFMRLHRAVAGGISAIGTRHLNILARALAPLHGLCYVSPSLVALAARKIYPHRIRITSPENERSMQWGSSLEAVKAMLEDITAEDVIEEVLQSVEVPL